MEACRHCEVGYLLAGRRRKRSQDQVTPALMPHLGDPEPGDGVYCFPRSLAHTIEPRAPIGKLGFTEGYPLLEIGENGKECASMHAAQYTTTPISCALIARTEARGPRGQAGGINRSR